MIIYKNYLTIFYTEKLISSLFSKVKQVKKNFDVKISVLNVVFFIES